MILSSIFSIKKIFFRVAVVLILLYGLLYSLFYTTLPLNLLSIYFKFTQDLDITYNNPRGYLLNQHGINIDSMEIKNSYNLDVYLNKINLKLNSIIRYDFDFSIDSTSINFNKNNIPLRKLTGNINKNNYYIYYADKPIIWQNDINKKNHINITVKKSLKLLDLLPEFSNFEITAEFTKNNISWNIACLLGQQVQEENNAHNLIITGNTFLKNYIPQNTSFDLKSNNNILLTDLKEAKIYGSPDLIISLDKNYKKLDITGEINIEQGTLTPGVSNNKESSDIEYIDTNNGFESHLKNNPIQNKEFSLDIQTNIKLITNNKKLIFKTKDLSTKLIGELNLSYNNLTKNNQLLAQGEITLIDGVYQLFGYPLNIKQGVLLYTNNPLDNPSIKIIGERKVALDSNSRDSITKVEQKNKTTNIYNSSNDLNSLISENKKSLNKNALVGINISGSINNPIIKLYSSVMMSEADQVSYLLFGVSSQNINQAQGQILLQTAKELFSNNQQDLNSITQSINKFLNVDELNFDNSSYLNPETGLYETQPTITIGKKFFTGLFLKYSIGLKSSVSKVTAEYELRKNLNLSAAYDSNYNGGADIVYSKETDHLL